jgi:magnesium chelatase family protein
MNPCPCGWLGAQVPGRACRCSPDQVARYQGRLSGPLLDRIDLQVEVAAVPPAELLAQAEGETSAAVAERVALAHARQQARQAGPNAHLEAGQLDALCPLDGAASRFLQHAAARLGWSGRGLHRAIKLARTIADLAGAERIAVPHLAEAMQYRRALPGA